MTGSLWIVATLIASALQTARNATQNSLTSRIGTLGATNVRFFWGFPFALMFLASLSLATGQPVPAINASSLGLACIGAAAQIGATALMLQAMTSKSFSVTTATIKTEPILVAIAGLVLLGDALTWGKSAAILIATSGVVLMALKPGTARAVLRESGPAALGVAAGALFGIAAVTFRGAILGLETGNFVMRATTILAWSLGLQVAMLTVYLALRDRPAFVATFSLWRPSLLAGFLGAAASQFWFIGFSLTSAANVRTLALVEVLMALFVSRRIFSQDVNRRELVAMALIVIGVALLLRVADA